MEANQQKNEGKCDLAQFIANRGSKAVDEALSVGWEFENAEANRERSQLSRAEILYGCLGNECEPGCGGQWIQTANEVLRQNNVPRTDFSDAPLAKWLEEKLKPLSTNANSVSDIFQLSEDIRNIPVDAEHILLSYDVIALFTNVPAHKTIGILGDKASAGNWFNNTYSLNLTKDQLMELLKLATTNQLFQLDGILYEQGEGVVMGSPLGPLLANTFMCSIEEKLEERNELPSFYKRYVDDTFTIMPDLNKANAFLDKLNSCHENLNFTMEIDEQGTISFVGMNITKCGNRLETSVHRKSTNTGLLLHYHSHVDKRYKRCLLSTMINRAYRLSSTPNVFSAECNKLRTTFLNLNYPVNLINSSINEFLHNIDNISAPDEASDGTSNIVVPLPFKDQKSAYSVKREMQNLNAKIGVQIKPVFQSKKISQALSLKEKKPPIVNNQCMVYKIQCDLCDTDYVGYTTRHLHQRICKHKYSAIGRHLEDHGLSKSDLKDKQFSVLRKCGSKFDWLTFEMLFIKELKPGLNTQKDAVRAKLFT
ncbi:uncharacterized protein [Montipora foliosa]|uniref:uncharacterized protein n=1 Tax=Montipora foliosa TaxID=591990 RepID=UPI0035F1655F